jgi:hypothetical protein
VVQDVHKPPSPLRGRDQVAQYFDEKGWDLSRPSEIGGEPVVLCPVVVAPLPPSRQRVAQRFAATEAVHDGWSQAIDLTKGVTYALRWGGVLEVTSVAD